MSYREINDAAADKSFAMRANIGLQIDLTQQELDSGIITGGITREQLTDILRFKKNQLKIWEYINELVDKDFLKQIKNA